MIHNKFRYLLTLVALFAISTGAWAQEEVLLTTVTATGQTTYSQTTEGMATVSLNGIGYGDANYGWLNSGTVTVEAPQGYTITRCVFRSYDGTPLADDQAPFTATIVYGGEGPDYVSAETSDGQTNRNMEGIKYIEVYGTAEPPLAVTWNKTTKQATFKMPAGDVELIPEYYPGMLTLGNAIEGGKLEVVGLTAPFTKLDVPATWEGDNTLLSAAHLPGLKEMTDAEAEKWTDAPNGYVILIYGFDGTKAKTATYLGGEFTNASPEEVTLSLLKTASADAELYYSSEAQMPAGFEKDEEGNIYVKAGTEFKVKAVPNEGYSLVSWSDDETITDLERTFTMGEEDLTLTATFSNEYNVALNAEGLSEAEAAAWKAATGDNAPAALPLEKVKYGTDVKVTYSGTKKVIGVKAAKKGAKTITIGDVELTYADGDTWETIVSKNSDKIKIVFNHIVQLEQPASDTYKYLDADGPVRPAHVIDPTKNYSWGTMQSAS